MNRQSLQTMRPTTTNQTIENRRDSSGKATDTGAAASEPRFSPKRPPLHHNLLRGPYYPQIDNPRQRQG